MSKTLFILGRQPALGAIELESLHGAGGMRVLPIGAAVLDSDPANINFARIGGSIKMCKVLTTLPFNDWGKISDYLTKNVPKHTDKYEPGKLTLGISTYGIKTNPKQINAAALSVKKAVKKSGRPVRVVPNKANELNSAQVLHNKLTDLPLGVELVLVKDGGSAILAQTLAIQNIEAYAARDQARPARDAKVGMLPPKLAQIIVNLAVDGASPNDNSVLLDPFCGTGVILQEAALMGFQVYGSDIDERMVSYTNKNLNWLSETSKQFVFEGNKQTTAGDATDYTWGFNPNFIAAETYLGRPFSALPSENVLEEVINDVNTIHKKFLQNISKQTKSGFRMCIAAPAWKTKTRFKHLKVLDSLEKLGYTRLKFVHADWEDLIYHREGQIVGRELVVLERI